MRALPLTARLEIQRLEDRCNPATAYLATDLISDLPGVAPITDPTLVNAWGISLNPNGGAFWVSARLFSALFNSATRRFTSLAVAMPSHTSWVTVTPLSRRHRSSSLLGRLRVLILLCSSPKRVSRSTLGR